MRLKLKEWNLALNRAIDESNKLAQEGYPNTCEAYRSGLTDAWGISFKIYDGVGNCYQTLHTGTDYSNLQQLMNLIYGISNRIKLEL